ncbi:MAG: SH3 domain-containing protein [Deltaproteobacteria bacterium]|nr:SH3 domain-containing protein [Deltaproteobacteria bacterium]
MRSIRGWRTGLGAAALAAALLLGVGLVWAQTLKVSQSNQQFYPEPNFASNPVGPAPVGAHVKVLETKGDWYRVEYQGKKAWLHRQAVPESPVFVPGQVGGGPVKQVKSDEVALAGKGFTAEVESGYRQKNPGLNYAQVDQIEAFRVDPGRLQSFIKEGGLNP